MVPFGLLWNAKYDFNADFLMSENEFLLSEIRFSDIINYFLISENRNFWYQQIISDIRKKFLISEIDFLISEIDFHISEIDFLISENDFLISEIHPFFISEIDFLRSENDFLISENQHQSPIWRSIDPLFWKLWVHWTLAQSQLDATLNLK